MAACVYKPAAADFCLTLAAAAVVDSTTAVANFFEAAGLAATPDGCGSSASGCISGLLLLLLQPQIQNTLRCILQHSCQFWLASKSFWTALTVIVAKLLQQQLETWF